MTPIPAVTFIHKTTQISQNCGVRWALRRCTWPGATIRRAVATGAVQPTGSQPAGGTR